MSTPSIVKPASTSSKPTIAELDLIGELSEWLCDPATCNISNPCDACKRRNRVARLLAQRDLERRPCSLDCTPLRPCERCREVAEYLEWLYLQRDQVAVLLRALRQLARVFPVEWRELLAQPVMDVIDVREGKA